MTKANSLVSIIVPVYGTERYLPACIDSLRRQSYPHIQIILIDDQSPDKCPEICDDYAKKDSRIIVIHQKNKGVSGARNAGMDHATGNYIMFVDSDDELYPDAVSLLIKDAEDHHADVVSATIRSVDRNGITEKREEDGSYSVFRHHEALLLSLEGNHHTNSACAKLFNTAFIQGLRFEEGKNVNEDGFFVFQCYMKEPVLVQHNIAVYQYNYRNNSGSRQVYSEKYLAMLYFCDRKKAIMSVHYPQYIEQTYNMEARTHLQFLQVLCSARGKQHKSLQKKSIQTVRRLYPYHKPINNHHKRLSWIVVNGLYPLYKLIVRIKYYK